MADSKDPTGDRYIHRPQPGFKGTRVILITTYCDDQITDQEWVHADDFMDVQQERDDYRRTLALINALPIAADGNLRAMLDGAGFSLGDAEAMRSLIAWARLPVDERG